MPHIRRRIDARGVQRRSLGQYRLAERIVGAEPLGYAAVTASRVLRNAWL
jgi:hypothetical protein